MSQVILNPDEAKSLARALSHLFVRERTGELGITHGMNRFVSTDDRFKKKDLEPPHSVFSKLGITLTAE